ncbi:MAG: alpha/beta hydrolase [Alphaproteobacteria bacterium]|nr:alpha/beta hydrolase [Alphaproteobacteria bacterium]
MKNALILHGTCDKDEYFDLSYPSLSNSHWFPWLQKQFLCHDILCQTPEMPKAYHPNYSDWKETFERVYNKDVKIIIGHSAGAGFMLKWLQNNPDVKLEKLILVAPWLDPDKEYGNFLDFQMNKAALNNIKKVVLFYSSDDEKEIINSVDQILSFYKNIKVQSFEDKGHFVYSTIGSTFSELWKVIVQ